MSCGTPAPTNPTWSSAALSLRQPHFQALQLELLTVGAEPELAVAPLAVAVAFLDLEMSSKMKALILLPKKWLLTLLQSLNT